MSEQQTNMILAVAEAITTRRPVSWVWYSDGSSVKSQ